MPRNIERQQHLERSQIELLDQHGRTWLVESEVGLDHTRRPKIIVVGQFFPQFQAPYDFYPDAKYLEYDPSKPGRLHINYQAWESAVRWAHEEVQSYISRLAVAIYKDEAAKYIKEPSQEMLDIVYGRGRGPEPVEPIVAARQGNGWILGQREFDPAIPGDVLLKGYLEKWVAVRYRDVRAIDDEAEGAVDALDFTEGQRKPRKVAAV